VSLGRRNLPPSISFQRVIIVPLPESASTTRWYTYSPFSSDCFSARMSLIPLGGAPPPIDIALPSASGVRLAISVPRSITLIAAM
jgi:hypothetical protein